MRRAFLTTVGLAIAGCGGPAQAGRAGHPTTVPTDSISVGQPWGEATAVATRAGYAPHDAAHSQAVSTDGFLLDLPARRGLVVLRDGTSGSVASIQWVDGWDGPRGLREYHTVSRFRLPPAESAAR